MSGDRILVRKLPLLRRLPVRGELIVFRNPEPTGGTAYIKRIIAVAGDRVVSGDRVLINGTPLRKKLISEEELTVLGERGNGQVFCETNDGHRYLVAYRDGVGTADSVDEFEAVVPERHVFVLGDNRARSKDSRHFGAVHVGDIVGSVDYIYWPSESWSRFGVADGCVP